MPRMRSRAERSWMGKGKSCRRSCETLKNSRVCRQRFRTASRMTCSSICRRWSKGGMTSCQNIRKCRKDHKRNKASRTKEGICRKKVLQHKRRCGKSESKSIEMRNAFDSCRTTSTRTKWLMQKCWQNFSRQEQKEEEAMHRKQVIAVWRSCGDSLSLWERIDWRLFYERSEEKSEHFRSRCQEEKQEEGTVKTNESEVKPVSSWCYQRQAGSMKALQRVVWCLISLVFGVHVANPEGKGSKKIQVRKRMPHWETCEWK